jgi:hypothetical protein
LRQDILRAPLGDDPTVLQHDDTMATSRLVHDVRGHQDRGPLGRQPVKLGVRTPTKTEILTGLEEDDLVVCGNDGNLGYVGRRAKTAK